MDKFTEFHVRGLHSASLGAMTANEQKVGRYIRDGDGHPPAPAPAKDAGDGDGDFKGIESDIVLPKEGETDFSLDDFIIDDGGNVSLDDYQDDEDSSSEGGDDDSGDDTPPPVDDEGVPPKEENPELQEALRRAKEAEERARRFEEKLLEREKPPTEEKPKAEDGKAEERDPTVAPDPKDYEWGAADERYLSDFAEWKINSTFAAKQAEAELRSEFDAIDAKWDERRSSPAVAEKYPDFEEKVTKGGDRGDWDCTIPMAVLIKQSDVGDDLAYHLATNPAEATRLAKLSPTELLQDMARLEGRFLAQNQASAKKEDPQPKRASEAPPPPEKRSRGAGGKFQTDEDALYSRMLKEFD